MEDAKNLIEKKLRLLLDLDSIKHLAESHDTYLASLLWKKIVRRLFPEDEKIRLDLVWSPMPLEDGARLAEDRPKARLLADILCLIKGPRGFS